MQPYQQFLIAPYKTGLDTDLTPWLLPVDAFTSIVNGHIHHGYIEKRNGIQLIAQMEYSTGPATEPMMGIYQYNLQDNTKIPLVFDTKRAGILNFTTYTVTPLDVVDIFDSGVTDHIWTANWQASGTATKFNRLYFTNGKVQNGVLNGIRYYESFDGSATVTTQPTLTINSTTSTVLVGAKLLFAFKGYLVALNVFEKTGALAEVQYPQRARWCARNNPDIWLEGPNNGGFITATTGDHIVSARALQDQIIVFFTDSVWSLRYTGNILSPFDWYRINDFRACGARMSTVGFDRYVMAFGVRGVTATDGVETRRIDDRIEEFMTDSVNTDNIERMFCLRDYANRRLWTLYSGVIPEDAEDVVNDSVLILDEESSGWSVYNLKMNVLGYGTLSSDFTYGDFDTPKNLDITYGEAGDDTYGSFFWQSNGEVMLGGSTDGFIYLMNSGNDTSDENIELSLTSASWNPFKDQGIECQLGYLDLYVDVNATARIAVSFSKNSETVAYDTTYVNCVPEDQVIGEILSITQASPAVVSVYQHGLTTGDEIFIQSVQGMTVVNGFSYIVTVISEDEFSLDGSNTTAATAYAGGGTIGYTAISQGRVWKRVFTGAIGFEHFVTLSSAGLNTPVKIHAFRIGARPRGRRTVQ